MRTTPQRESLSPALAPVFDFLAAEPGTWFNITEIAAELRIKRATCRERLERLSGAGVIATRLETAGEKEAAHATNFRRLYRVEA